MRRQGQGQDRRARPRGETPLFGPGLDDLIASNTRDRRLAFTCDFSTSVAQAQAVFIAVGTPSRRGDRHADLSYVYAAAREIAAAIDGFTVIITKSTVPVGTGEEVARIIHETRPDADVAIVSNSEFLREGAAIQDFKHPDRIVVGFVVSRSIQPRGLDSADHRLTAGMHLDVLHEQLSVDPCRGKG